jgi:uncharacterized protein involved in exopolysaccharide biosynthesis
MSAPSTQPTARKLTPWRGFAAVFALVFLMVFGGGALITWLLPESYLGVARVSSATGQSEMFQNDKALHTVVLELNLERRFAARYHQQEPLSRERALDILRRSLEVRAIRGTPRVEIRAYSHSPEEAALLANGVARAGISNILAAAPQAQGKPEQIDIAVPSRKPARPNKAVNLLLGALVGAFLGIMAGGVGARLAVGYDREDAARRNAGSQSQ